MRRFIEPLKPRTRGACSVSERTKTLSPFLYIYLFIYPFFHSPTLRKPWRGK